MVEVEQVENQPKTPEPFPDSPDLNDLVEVPEKVPKNIVGDDRSLIALLAGAPKVQQRILDLQERFPEYLTIDEPSFKRTHRELITLVTQRLRVSMWTEFESAIQGNRLMRIRQIYSGTCAETTFYSLIDNPVRLAYILCPPADYIIMLKEAHSAGLEKLREIFSAVIIDEDGYLNPKAADIVLKAYALLDARLKGAIIQRIDQRTLTAQVPAARLQESAPKDMDVLEKQLKAARLEIEKYTQIPRHPTPMELREETKDIVIDVVDMNMSRELGGNSKILK